MLGLELHSWEQLMLWALGAAALAAVAVVVTTAAVVVSQRDENNRTKAAFEKYKLDTSKEIADANARALESQLARIKLEAKLKPRWDISKEQMKVLIAALAENKERIGTIFLCKFAEGDDREAAWFAATIEHAMREAGIDLKTKEISSEHVSKGIITLDGLVTSAYGDFELFHSGGTTSAGLYDAFSKAGLIDSFGGAEPLDRVLPRPYLFVLLKPPPFTQKIPDWAMPESQK